MGNDDYSAECWIKLNRGRLTPSYCKRKRDDDHLLSLASSFFPPKTVLQLVSYSSFFFCNFMYLTLTDSKSNSSGAQRETVVQVKPLFE